MAQVDPNRIIKNLALKLAQSQIDLAMAEILIEDQNSQIVELRTPSADYTPADVSNPSGE